MSRSRFALRVPKIRRPDACRGVNSMRRIEETSMSTLIPQLRKRLVRAGVLIALLLLVPFASANDDFQILSWQGVIETIDVSTNQIVVGGVRYSVAADANVEIGGSYGAFTLLQPGM